MRRVDFIDVFKGFGIFFVILGHMPIRAEMYSYIFSFQLAIFYFVGGFLYRDAHVINSFWDYISRKFRRTLIPYIVFSLISLIVYTLYHGYMGNDYDILDMLSTVITSKRNEIYINVPLWFLTSFFTVEIMYYILKCFFNNYVICILVIIFGFIGVVNLRTTGSLNTLPWSFDASLYFIIYYFMGDFFSSLSTYLNRDFSYFFRKLFLVFLISILISAMNLLGLIEHADIIYYDHGFFIALVSYLFHIFISLSGVFSYLFLAYIFRWVYILRFIGKNSIYYFAFHMIIYCILCNQGLTEYFLTNVFSDLELNLVGIIYTVALIIAITPLVWVINFFKKIIYQR